MTAAASNDQDERAATSRTAATPTAPSAKCAKPRRPKFDKAASTTVLLAALLGLGAGATWQLVKAAPLAREPEGEAVLASPTGGPTRVIVVDTNGLVVATFDSAIITTGERPSTSSTTAAVALNRGRSRAPVAASRAS